MFARLTWLSLLFCSIVSLSGAEVVPIKTPDHPIVSGFERFYHSDKNSAVDGGMLLLGELNCISCHATPAAAQSLILPKAAPILGAVAQRADPKFIERFLLSTHTTKAGTTMPSLLSGMEPTAAADAARALTHYLVAQANAPFGRDAVDQIAVGRGETLFHEIGCVACHAPRIERPVAPDPNAEEDEAPLVDLQTTSIPLSRKLHEKYSLRGLTEFLQNPLAVRPAGRMPQLNLKPAEASDIAQYLLRDTIAPAPLKLEFFAGNWDKLPDLNTLKPQTTGSVAGFDLTGFAGRDQFAVRFSGFLRIEKAGEYTFYLTSDDGSRLTINNQTVIDNDGVHPATERKGKVQLQPGLHAIRVEYFENGGEEVLSVAWSGPDLERQPIPSSQLTDSDKPRMNEDTWKPDPQLAKQGSELFASLGCANCHQLQHNQPLNNKAARGPALVELTGAGGCLSDAPRTKNPYYKLNSRQITALAAAIKALRTNALPQRTPADQIHHRFVALNCYACHERNDQGGVIIERGPYFTANLPDLGDEGRIPPRLTGVGDKLKDTALQKILVQAAVARPYVNTRMPQFGEKNLGPLVEQLAAVDRTNHQTPVTNDNIKEQRTNGHKLVGKEALTCVSCHTFNGGRSLGIQVMDLTLMADRLRPEWFHRYMLNPSSFRPGTRMPSAFNDGKSTYTKIYDGDATRQLAAIWAYLSSGRKAKFPDGVIPEGMELLARDEAIMYRNFIKDGGPRAIGVGYPEQVNLVFDANHQRLALIWQGKFIDGSRHWEGRGQGYQPPLGEKILPLGEGPTWAVLPTPETAWPTKTDVNKRDPAFRFGGYELDEVRRPTFLYELLTDKQPISIRDFPHAISENDGKFLRRTLTVTAPNSANNLYLRVAMAAKLNETSTGYVVNDQLTIRIGGDFKPLIRQQGKERELLIPIPIAAGKSATITLEYQW